MNRNRAIAVTAVVASAALALAACSSSGGKAADRPAVGAYRRNS